jgi:predicted RND superfamily exporter protein
LVDRSGEVAAATARWATRRPILLGAALLVITVGLGLGLLRLTIEASFESFLDEGHPLLRTTNEVVGTYGTHLPLLVTLDAGRPVTPADIEAVTPFFESLETLPHVDRVSHPGNTNVLKGTGDGLEIRPLLDVVRDAGDTRASALSYSLIGKSGTSLAAAVFLEYRKGHDDRDSVEAMVALRERLDAGAAPEGYRLRLAGLVNVYAEVAARVRHDLGFMLGLSLLGMALFLAWVYRSPSGVIAPLGVVLITQIWTFGLMGWLGISLSVAMILLPPLVTVIGCADALHYLNQAARHRAAHPEASPVEWVVEGARHVALPCLLTSVTTMAGFLSLTATELRPMRIFGVMAAVAIGIALLLTFTALPALMRMLPPRVPPADDARRGDPVQPFLRLTHASLGHGRLVALLWAALCVAAIVLAGRVRIETGFDNLFPAGDPVALDQRWVEDELWGSDVLGVRWHAPPGGDLLDAASIEALTALCRALSEQPEVTRVIAAPAFLEELRDALLVGEDHPPPWSRQLAAQLMLLLEQSDPDLLDHFVTADRREAVLILQVDTIGAAAMRDLVLRVEERLRSDPVPGRTSLFGPVFIFQSLILTMVEGLMRSFGLALVLVWVMVSIGLRSILLGTLGMVPNVVPVLVAAGVMGLFDISLNDNTVMVASIGIGIAVDDTVHLLIAWRRGRAAGLSPSEAVDAAVAKVGRALVATSLVLLIGFSPGLLASFRPPQTFSALSCVVIVVALLADLLLLTLLLRRLDPAQPIGTPVAPGLDVGEDL